MNKKIRRMKKEIKRWLKYTSIIKFIDESDYEIGLSNDGGGYIYWTTYKYIPQIKKFEVSYGCSSSFEYCPVCGSFSDHYVNERFDEVDIYGSGFTCGAFKLISFNEMAVSAIRNMTNHEKVELYYQ